MGALREACWEERALDLVYVDTDGQRTERRIWPLSIIFFEKVQMCLAWCCLRQDFRKFIVARMATITPEGESFRPRRVALLREFTQRLRSGQG